MSTSEAPALDTSVLRQTVEALAQRLLSLRDSRGVWTGHLSSSALSTATAISALSLAGDSDDAPRIAFGVDWLLAHCNADGGWGDTADSPSNLSTTLLAIAALKLAGRADAAAPAMAYVTGVAGETSEQWQLALQGRYGVDRTFAVPILTNLALAQLVPWSRIPSLPWALAALPTASYKAVRLHVVSYALPALIAIGLRIDHERLGKNLAHRLLTRLLRKRVFARLSAIQPDHGGFLDAIPLTSFVAMSLAHLPEAPRQVTDKCVGFLRGRQRPDGSWPIDTNLAIWLTTNSVNALAEAQDALGDVCLAPEGRHAVAHGVSRGITAENNPKLRRGDTQPTSPECVAPPGLSSAAHVEPMAHAMGYCLSPLPGLNASSLEPCDLLTGACLAPEGRHAVAHGVSRGITTGNNPKPRRGDTLPTPPEGVAPPGLSSVAHVKPMAHAMGYCLSPLPGLNASSLGPCDPRCSFTTDIIAFLLCTQHQQPHPYTAAAPGGWAWTDLPGGVPDADDTSGAILALARLHQTTPLQPAVRWLLSIQNADGGFPTFCRGWGKLPFDQSAPDVTAHAIRALSAAQHVSIPVPPAALSRALHYLNRVQAGDGSFKALWFGSQFTPDHANPVFGTARVLRALADHNLNSPTAQRALAFLLRQQNADGGWGAAYGIASTVEETSQVVSALTPWRTQAPIASAADGGVEYLLQAIERGQLEHPSPIGLYFASLWYSEQLYPLIWALEALARTIHASAEV